MGHHDHHFGSPELEDRIISFGQSIFGIITIFVICLVFRLFRNVCNEFLKNHSHLNRPEKVDTLEKFMLWLLHPM
jgi:hypothetical protein